MVLGVPKFRLGNVEQGLEGAEPLPVEAMASARQRLGLSSQGMLHSQCSVYCKGGGIPKLARCGSSGDWNLRVQGRYTPLPY
jgi:hypothetical protein